MKLLIVESPNKTKKIAKYLGSGYQVMASVGHIRDLPKKELGVDLDTFRPDYLVSPEKKDVVVRLKKAAESAEAIYLGTDPDREGEAISWHLAEALSLKKLGKPVRRVRFHEISKSAIEKAIQGAGDIDIKLVAAQEARRVLDRLVGYRVSSVLMRGLSAGRVQSPALRLVVEREREIRDFKPETYFEVMAAMNQPFPWQAIWQHQAYRAKDDAHFKDRAIADAVARARLLTVVSVEKKRIPVKAKAPFTTSSLQQSASIQFRMPPEKTMEVAQSLFAQGAITYHRTDSPNLSDDAIDLVRSWLKKNGFPHTESANRWAAKDGAQEAHEAIRPVDPFAEDAGETQDEKALYRMIRLRALASQMPPAEFDRTDIRLEADVSVPMDGKKAIFGATGRVPTANRGWMALLDEPDEDGKDKDGEAQARLPNVKEGQKFDCECRVDTRQTKPPGRYTEASLVARLESLEIGRPSTYAAILKNIKTREYIAINSKRQIEAAPKGEMLVDRLVDGGFSFLAYEYTRNLEKKLDDIAEGKAGYKSVVGEANGILDRELSGMPAQPAQSFSCGDPSIGRCGCGGDIQESPKAWNCASCQAIIWKTTIGRAMKSKEALELFVGKTLDLKGFKSKAGNKFDTQIRMENGKASLLFGDRKANAPANANSGAKPCPKCEKPLRIRKGPKGSFWGCSGYPECRHAEPA